MTPQDWDTFFRLLDQAGQQPTVINDAHAKVIPAADTLPASPNRDTILYETRRAEDANGKMGRALENLEQWGKQHQGDSGDDGGGTPPPTDPYPPGTVMAYPTSDPRNTPTRKYAKDVPQGVTFTWPGSGKKKCSWTISSGGYPCVGGFDPNNLTGATGATPWQESPDGNWTYYLRYDADPGRKQDTILDVVPV